MQPIILHHREVVNLKRFYTSDIDVEKTFVFRADQTNIPTWLDRFTTPISKYLDVIILINHKEPYSVYTLLGVRGQIDNAVKYLNYIYSSIELSCIKNSLPSSSKDFIIEKCLRTLNKLLVNLGKNPEEYLKGVDRQQRIRLYLKAKFGKRWDTIL